MPTVIILDVSASLLRPADPSDANTTRQDVAQRGVLQLLQWMEKWQKLEPVCLLTMSSSCQVLVPFETDPKILRTALYDVHLQDTASISAALCKACGLLQEQYGVDAVGCQVVLVVDGGPSFSELEDLETLIPQLPRSIVFHTMVMGTDWELQRCDIYKSLVSRSRGSFTSVRVPQDAGTYKKAFLGLASRFYQPYRGSLVCGHLQASMMLYPDPNLGYDHTQLNGQQDGQAAQHHQDAAAGGPVPTMAAIRGFVPMKDLFAVKNGQQIVQIMPQTPIERRHVILPDTRGLMAPDGEVLGGGGDNPQLFHYLLQCLTAEELVAVCHFKNPHQADSKGCCFIMPIATESGDNKSGTPQLSLFMPRLAGDTGTLPLHMLTQAPMQKIMTLGFEQKGPVQTENAPTLETLQTDLTKFMKTLSKLPVTKENAYKECERLRKSSQIYLMPSLREAVVSMVESVASDCYQGSSKDENLAKYYLKDMIKQMSRSDSTQLVTMPKEPKEGRPTRAESNDKANAASINNLLC